MTVGPQANKDKPDPAVRARSRERRLHGATDARSEEGDDTPRAEEEGDRPPPGRASSGHDAPAEETRAGRAKRHHVSASLANA
jgi:hypothetical protein